MVDKETLDRELLEWGKKQSNLECMLFKYIHLYIDREVNALLVDDDHVNAFVSEYFSKVMQELRSKLDNDLYIKVIEEIEEREKWGSPLR
jgi:Ribonuclease G/E